MDHVNPWVDAAEMMRLAEALLASPLITPRAPADAGFGGEFVGYEPQTNDMRSSQQILQSGNLQIPITTEHSSLPAMRSEAKMSSDPLPSLPSPELANSSFQNRLATTNPQFNKPSESAITQHPWSISALPTQIHPPVPIAPPLQTAIPPVVVAPPASGASNSTLILERLVHFRAVLRQHFGTRGVFLLDQNGKAIFDDADHGKLYFMARSLAFASKNHPDEIGNVHVRVGSTTSLVVIPADTAVGKIVLGLVVDQAIPTEALPHILRALHAAVSSTQAH